MGTKAEFEPDRAELAERIATNAKAGDVVLCMTVSGYQDIAPELAKRLNEQ